MSDSTELTCRFVTDVGDGTPETYKRCEKPAPLCRWRLGTKNCAELPVCGLHAVKLQSIGEIVVGIP